MFLGRRVGRAEVAESVSKESDTKFMKNFARKWFFDRDFGIVLYGNNSHMIG